jgi:hypothetical protein
LHQNYLVLQFSLHHKEKFLNHLLTKMVSLRCKNLKVEFGSGVIDVLAAFGTAFAIPKEINQEKVDQNNTVNHRQLVRPVLRPLLLLEPIQ